MLDSTFDVKLGDVKYRIAEDVENEGYVRRGEPLRTPTGNAVLGDPGRFHLRPDLIEWGIDNWDGGEGQIRYDGSQDKSNRYRRGFRIDPFTLPGKIQLSPDVEKTNRTGPVEMDESLHMAPSELGSLDGVAGLDRTLTATKKLWFWNKTTELWTTGTPDTAASSALQGIATALGSIWYTDSTGIRRLNGGTYVSWSTTMGGSHPPACIVGDFLYTSFKDGEVWEVPLTGTAPVTAVNVYTITEGGTGDMAAGRNRVWATSSPTERTMVLHEITPTTAAAAGFGREVDRVNDFKPSGIIVLLGVVYVLGAFDNKPAVYYHDPINETSGILVLFQDRPFPAANHGFELIVGGPYTTSGFKAKFLVRGGPTADNLSEWTVMTLEPRTGGVAGGSVFTPTPGSAIDFIHANLAVLEGELFASLYGTGGGATTAEVWREIKDTFSADVGILEISSYDFQIGDEKTLQTVQLSMDALPSGCQIELKYRKDGASAWTSAGTVSTVGTTQHTFTFTTAVTFTDIEFRVELSNGGNTAVTPTLTNITARARVLKKVRTWDLVLDATDEDGHAQNRSWNGSTLLDNIKALGQEQDVITFLDGYGSRDPNAYETFSVIVDDYRVIQDRPGEGMVMVRLIEVT